MQRPPHSGRPGKAPAAGPKPGPKPGPKQRPPGQSPGPASGPASAQARAEALFREAVALYNQGRFEPAEARCRQVLELVPKQPNALHLDGLIRLRKGDAEGAVPRLKRAATAMPDAAEPAMHLANALQALGRSTQALRHLDAALAAAPDFAEAHFNRALVLESRDETAAAAESYRAAIASRPTYETAYANLSGLLARTGEPEAAENAVRDGLARLPGSAALHTTLANLLAARGETDAAADHYREAVTQDPTYRIAHNNLGVLLQNTGAHAEAADAFAAADTPYARAKALECRLHVEDPAAVHREIARAAEREPQNRRLAALSAYVSERCGLPDPYRFCPDPFAFVSIRPDLGGRSDARELLARVQAALADRPAAWEPGGATTRQGYQTEGNLFDGAGGPLAKLEKVLRREIAAYRAAFADADCGLIRDWPAETELSGWFVRLLSGGHQAPHIHPRAWLSGVMYLDLPPQDAPQAGAIAFSLRCDEYPRLAGPAGSADDGPTLLHEPAVGELILFPSTLFHRTLPFHGERERLSLAFDVIPVDRSATAAGAPR